MLITSSLRPHQSVANRKPVAQNPSNGPSDSFTFSNESAWTLNDGMRGAARGFARGAGLGLTLDVATLGLPGIVGYLMTGNAAGAVTGLAVLPVVGGLIHGCNGFADPSRRA